MRLTLKDPKGNQERDLVFCPLLSKLKATKEGLAKEEAALLALHHIAPDMPLEKSLPEPFRAQWLGVIS